jgi:hypothetical protein
MYDEVTDDPVWPAVADKVAAYRTEAQDAVVGQGNWNPDGTHRSTFFNTSVSGVDLGAGVQQDDPFVAADVTFQGMLVDLEPYGAFTSQLFFDAITFGVAGGYRIFCPRRSRFTDRYINFRRNPTNNMIAGVASVVWQSSFPKDGEGAGPGRRARLDGPVHHVRDRVLRRPDAEQRVTGERRGRAGVAREAAHGWLPAEPGAQPPRRLRRAVAGRRTVARAR